MATTVLASSPPTPRAPCSHLFSLPSSPFKARSSARLCHAASGNVVASSDAPMLDLLSRPSYKVANATPTVQCKPSPPSSKKKETFRVWLLNLLCFYLAFLFFLFSAALSFLFLFLFFFILLYAPFRFSFRLLFSFLLSIIVFRGFITHTIVCRSYVSLS